MKYKHKIIWTIMFGILVSILMFATIVSAETYKVNTPAKLTSSCTFSGAICTSGQCWQSIKNLDGSYVINYQNMTSVGNGKFQYNYTFNTLGTYINEQTCCQSGICKTAAEEVVITPSGNVSGGSNLGLFIIAILVVYGIAFIGFFGKNEWVTIFGGLAMLGLGIYTINNGIVIYRDFMTNMISWTTIGLGGFFAIFAGVEVIKDSM